VGGWILASLFLAACSGGSDDAGDDAATTVEEGAELEAPPDVAAPPEDAEVTPSGLASKVLKPGTGTEKPTAESRVTVHYTGWTASDGERFDSSVERGEPATFGLGNVIAGWTEGLQLMVKGEKRRLWIPQELAYRGQPGKPAGMLTFDVELIDFQTPPGPPESLTPPDDATKTPGGVSYVVVEPGTGTEKITADDTVQFQFAAWLEDGKPFQNSYASPQTPRGRVADFPASWKEFVVGMVEGQRVVAYVPAGMDEMPNAPENDLIFDFVVEKIEVPVPAPDNVAAAPADAKKTESGVAYQILEEGGEGASDIGPRDMVKLHFTIWNSESGEMLENTRAAASPPTLPASRLPTKGWIEAAQALSKGDKARVWIPAELGFPESAPLAGPMTIDMEILDVIQPPAPRVKAKTKAAPAPAPE